MDANQIVAEVAGALESLGIPYMLAGSYSSNFYGLARATRDADFVIQLGTRSIGELVALLGRDYVIDPQMSFETVTATSRFVMKHRQSKFKVELFLLSDDLHDCERFARRKPVTMAGRQIQLPTPEDIVIMKLRWSRGGGRVKDAEDVEHVLELQRDSLDLDYIRQWTDRHGTRDLFETLWSKATGAAD